MNILTQGIYSLLCVVGFSVLFNLPRRLIPLASITGMIGWIIYSILQQLNTSFIIPALIGSIFVGIIGEISAIYKKQPATLFIIPGIIPFVPGYGIYYTMFHVINNDFIQAAMVGAESLFIAISIACGVVIATSIVRFIRPFIEKRMLIN
ncbi:MAG: threonine/serine exporter family protein [Clostridia bacterium]|nr:threonine/serine exporter family protein [Clostridia bacterium]